MSFFNWTSFFGAVKESNFPQLEVNSSEIKNDGDVLFSNFEYRRNEVKSTPNGVSVTPKRHQYRFQTTLKPKKTGLLLVGLGGNNGSTVVGATIANREKMSWNTRNGVQKANYFGSITQSTTVHIGWDGSKQVYIPFNGILPMVNPNDLIIDGWDINNANLYEAMLRSKVFEPDLISQLKPHMETLVPKPSIYYPDFIASNQEDRANNIIPGNSNKRAMDEYICSIFMGGHQTLAIHNTCEDSLLAAPLILDLAIITELCSRIQYANESNKEFSNFHSVLSLLSLLLKAPVVPRGTPVGNAFMKQFGALTKLLTACAGIASDVDLQLEFFTKLA
ncbi:hypothetical protein FO519_009735 [Halicephalobus sp. NKZ332]|nr:hypothetical protein FO519_009735 [Halicephalobus sp. NKZ332]